MPSNTKHVRVGITGGIGSGKTTACRYFEKLGYTVIYADNIAKELYATSPSLKKKLVRAFGKGILDENGDISGAKARKIILSGKKNILRVNKLVHPFVVKEIDRRINKIKTRIVLIETAIMFESGYYKRNDYNVLIYANKSLRTKRVSRRDKLAAAAVKKLMALQMKEEEKIMMADFIIKNNGTVRELYKDIKLFSNILKTL